MGENPVSEVNGRKQEIVSVGLQERQMLGWGREELDVTGLCCNPVLFLIHVVEDLWASGKHDPFC